MRNFEKYLIAGLLYIVHNPGAGTWRNRGPWQPCSWELGSLTFAKIHFVGLLTSGAVLYIYKNSVFTNIPVEAEPNVVENIIENVEGITPTIIDQPEEVSSNSPLSDTIDAVF